MSNLTAREIEETAFESYQTAKLGRHTQDLVDAIKGFREVEAAGYGYSEDQLKEMEAIIRELTGIGRRLDAVLKMRGYDDLMEG
jgi:hypothetical protein